MNPSKESEFKFWFKQFVVGLDLSPNQTPITN